MSEVLATPKVHENLDEARQRIDFEKGSCEQDKCRFNGSALDVLHLCVVCARATCIACCAMCENRPELDICPTEPGGDAVCYACNVRIVQAALGQRTRPVFSTNVMRQYSKT